MATTNIQTFSGDVEVTSNILMSGEVFIKANDGNGKVGIGLNAGATSQEPRTTAVGQYAGQSYQSADATAMGNSAGQTSQQYAGTAVGLRAGQTSQGNSATAVGNEAGLTAQGVEATAVGLQAGRYNQGAYATALGRLAGETSQGSYATAVGSEAGRTSQGALATAVGYFAGETSQGASATAVGLGAGRSYQGANAVAVGDGAGAASQGDFAVALGYLAGYATQHDNTSILNATGLALNTAQASSFYVAPVRDSYNAAFLRYDVTSKEITYTAPIVASGTITLSPGAWSQLVNFNDAGLTGGATYAIEIVWTNDTTGGIVWYGGASGVIFGNGNALAEYNSAPGELITLNQWYHHRTTGAYEFVIDSNTETGAYGDPTLFIKSPAGHTNTFTVTFWRI